MNVASAEVRHRMVFSTGDRKKINVLAVAYQCDCGECNNVGLAFYANENPEPFATFMCEPEDWGEVFARMSYAGLAK